MNKRFVLAGLCAVMLMATAQATDTTWVASWGSSPLEGNIVIPGVPPDKIPPSPVLKGTVRYRLPLNLGGSRLVLRLTNEPNKEPLTVGAVTVGIAATGLDVRAGSMRPVTFGGRTGLTLPGGTPAISDPVDLPTSTAEALIVSVYLPNATQFPLGQRGIQEVTLDSGDATQSLTLSGAAPAIARTVVSAVLVASAPAARTIVAFGDSITDGGVTDTPDVRGWPGHLARRLAQGRDTAHVAVANEGIGGNRVLNDIIGLSALARFDRDVLSLPNVSHVILLEGINDIGFASLPDNHSGGPVVDANALIAAYRQIIARAHHHGIKVIGGTLLPYQGAMYYTEAGEQTREAVNEWIRRGGEFDAVVDFDSALRDPASTKQLAKQYDSGDHLHPSDAGNIAMSQEFNLKVFAGPK